MMSSLRVAGWINRIPQLKHQTRCAHLPSGLVTTKPSYVISSLAPPVWRARSAPRNRSICLPGPRAPLSDQRGDGQHGLAFAAMEMVGQAEQGPRPWHGALRCHHRSDRPGASVHPRAGLYRPRRGRQRRGQTSDARARPRAAPRPIVRVAWAVTSRPAQRESP